MAHQIISRAQAFQPGCPVWFVPHAPTNPLIRKMDWYLNFQLTRAQLRQPEKISAQLRFIMTENNLPEFHQITDGSKPLMIASRRGLPTDRVIEIPQSAKVSDWAEKIHAVWESLDRPAFRVFLPTQFSAEEFIKIWQGSPRDEIQVVSG